ncbi:MAG TPA: (deoxy)nucleoside triphosphate pyrophosphohydrolase [Bacteroidales bacterium]|nr:(deoxy)nucleoside triphosphate pyrophosphohydrolase [Bacteroidales bacterium]
MIEVTCAVIRNDEGKVLVVRRGPGMGNAGKWEFPGGKIKGGETYEDCLIREIHEELGIDIILSGTLKPVEHDYGDKHIRLYPFICDTLASRLILTEHDAHQWLTPDELPGVNLSAADVPVAIDYASGNYSSSVFTDMDADLVPLEQAQEELANVIRNISDSHEISMMARSAQNDPSIVGQLITLSLDKDTRLAFLSSWILSKVVDSGSEVTVPYLCNLIDALPGLENQSVLRCFLRVLSKNKPESIPASHHGLLVDYCFAKMRKASDPVAPKVYSMEILAGMCDIYPDMKSEVASTIGLVVNDASGGIKSQARKLITKLMRDKEQ